MFVFIEKGRIVQFQKNDSTLLIVLGKGKIVLEVKLMHRSAKF